MRVDMYTHDLTRIGTLPSLSGRMILTLNGVHQWSTTVDATNPKWARFTENSRVVISDEHGTYLSGMGNELGHDTDEAGAHTVPLAGVSDETVLAEMVTLPDPAKIPDDQKIEAYYKQTAPAETVMRDLVRRNIGPDAQDRYQVPHLVMEPDQGRGETVTVNSRFKPLLDEVQELSTAGGVNFRIIQEGRQIVTKFSQGRDLSKAVRLTQAKGAVGASRYRKIRPTVTEVIVAGQGEGENRTIISVPRDPGKWDRRITVFKDRRDTDDPTELRQAANVDLDEAAEVASVTARINDAKTKRFGRDFWLGDTITVILADGTKITDVVTEAAIKWDSTGRTVDLTVGPKLPSPEDPLWVPFVNEALSRIRNLERI